MTPDEFRALGHRLIDWLADYRTTLEQRPVRPASVPGECRAGFPTTPPDQPTPPEVLLADLDRLILPHLTHWQHPSFFGYFPANAEPASVLGDLLSTGLGVLGLSWQACPALTEVEDVVLDWCRQLVGLSDAWQGVIQDTASTSTLVALLCARERSTRYSSDRGGLQEVERPQIVYLTEQSHSSVDKAALLAGFGRHNLRRVAHDAAGAMRPDALDEAISADLTQGLQPCAIVATTGTTSTTALDPVEALAVVAQRHRLWLHVDAAMAGSAMILPECRWMWQGVEQADSLVLNLHKWLGVAFDCSLYYVRDSEHLVRVMSTNPSYLQTAADGRARNLRDWGIPLGRRFRALKAWMLLRAEGVAMLQARLRRDLALAQWLADQVRATPGWAVVAPVPLQTVCVRHTPQGLEGEALDQHTRAWVERLNHSGRAYLTPSLYEGRWMVRVSIGSLTTERRHVEALWTQMRQAAEQGGAMPISPG
ncbi:MAG: pyridoxal-dependent decarboxylase [Gemmataceae bacterium]